MTAKILAASPAVEQIKNDLRRRCDQLKAKGSTPSMSVVLVGDNPASLSYIKNKRKLCLEIGADFDLVQLPSSISQEEFLKKIEQLNHDPKINGIIIQLPVSEQLKDLPLHNLVVPVKDIDGFHDLNTQALYLGSTDLKLLLPCTPKGVIHLLKHYEIPVAGKHVVIIGRSLIVGKPLSMLLSNMNATVTLAHSRTVNLPSFTRSADIVISAVGIPHYLNASHFNLEKKTVVIDVGINSYQGKLAGDIDLQAIQQVVAAVSPVPGGVGPMTVVSLIENLITATEKQLKG
jgi:methylenetetrahydrofolate dehydrogenase (NADP+)/methenyltetrahydrofolate cyclohydrolase